MRNCTCPRSMCHPGSGEIIIVLILIIVLIVILYPVFTPHPGPSRRSQCHSNMRQLVLAIQLYKQDHGDKFPDQSIVWRDLNYPPKALLCPTYGMKNGIAYGYNASLSGQHQQYPGNLPQAQLLPVIADSRTPDHLLTSTADIDPRHTQKATVGFADGHVELLLPADVRNLPVKKGSGDDAK
ncbi:MAG: hypothetical protein ACYC6A_16660 [Armatimonadota bacterium]